MITEIHTEDITHCVHDDAMGGIATRIFYAPLYCFNKFVIPDSKKYKENRLIKQEDITIKGLYQLKHVDVFIEQGQLDEKLFGAERRWKSQSGLSFSILKMKGEHLAFMSSVANSGLVFFVPDANGITWIFGTPKNPAYVISGEANTNKKYEEDSIVNMSLRANSPLYQYDSDVNGVKRVGAFTFGFTNGFKN